VRVGETWFMERVEVWRGKFGDPVPPLGPLPGVRLGRAVAYEFTLPDQFVPWPGRTRLERAFVLVDLGISMSQPQWRTMTRDDGAVIDGIDHDREAQTTWYVDLVDVTDEGNGLWFRDLWIDAMVPTDGRHYRMLDLDEYADAIDAQDLPLDVALDGLRRWQRFLDEFLHSDRDPRAAWTDFPPSIISEVASVPAPLS